MSIFILYLFDLKNIIHCDIFGTPFRLQKAKKCLKRFRFTNLDRHQEI